MNVDQLTEFFKWMTLINIGLLIFSSVIIMALKKVVYRMHGQMFSLAEDKIALVVYWYLGMFKVLIIVFCIVPYLALSAM